MPAAAEITAGDCVNLSLSLSLSLSPSPSLSFSLSLSLLFRNPGNGREYDRRIQRDDCDFLHLRRLLITFLFGGLSFCLIRDFIANEMNGNGNGTFNSQILVDKLTKLNTSQQSIETLSHWCIFHRMKARQVVEIWDRQFHHSPRDQRLSFLYLANDILQNSRRKGVEFVTEFWKVLPDALNDLIEKGDDFGRKAALRLVEIWEDRKVFGSRGHVLKEEILGRNSENRKSSEKSTNYKLKIPGGELLEKIISDYDHIYNGHIDEKALLGQCSSAINSMMKMNQEIGSDLNSGNISSSGAIEELKGWHNILRECVGQLKIAESSRMALQSHLREALHEQELKLEQVRDQLQAMLSRYEQTSNILLQLQSMNTTETPPEAKTDEASASVPDTSADFTSDNCSIASGDYNIKQESVVPVRYTQQQQQPPLPLTDSSLQPEEELRKKVTAAEVAAKLTSSTSSAQMLSYVFSSLASESIIDADSHPMKEDYSSSHHIGKRPKIENGCGSNSNSSTVLSYLPTQPQSQPPPPPFPHPDSVNPPPPPPPSSPPTMVMLPPLMPPVHLSHFIRPMGALPAMAAVPYSFASSHSQMQPFSYSAVGMPLIRPIPPNNDNNGNNTDITLQGFQMADGGFGSFMMLPETLPPLSRQ